MVLQHMVKWWEARTLQTRLDCAMARLTKAQGHEQCYGKAAGAGDEPTEPQGPEGARSAGE